MNTFYYVVDTTGRSPFDNRMDSLKFISEPISDKAAAVRECRRLIDNDLVRTYALVRGNICTGVSFCSLSLD